MNRNTLYSTIFVDELARSGLKAVCAAPGSRHTPLMLAFAKHPDINVYSHLDERSASFFALGLALASDEPVALICTSGSAGANMYPAIIEAHQSRVPLIVITADRPPELRHSGANQTIDQVKMFGDFVLWFVDMALPESNPSALAIRNLRTTANRAFATANGIRKGVVHLNMPFRKPLEPTEVEGDMVEIPERQHNNWLNTHIYLNTRPANVSAELIWLTEQIITFRKGILIASSRSDKTTLMHLISDFTGYPLLTESISYERHGSDSKAYGGYDAYLPFAPKPDVIIRFGDVPISKALNQFIENSKPKLYIHLSPGGGWSDDSHSLTHVFDAHPESLLSALSHAGVHASELTEENPTLQALFTMLEAATWETIDDEIASGGYFDGAVVYDVVELIPAESTLFAGNSLPVRHLDQFGKPQDKRIYTYANRGASGIDGNISSALGAGAARPDHPLVAILGDITFYHDMNGLLAVHRCGVPITIVLLNNDGGGIFHRLPIRDYEPEFTEYFQTPHGLDYSHAAKMYGLDHIRIEASAAGSREAFRQAFSERVGSGQSTIIEVMTDPRHDEQRRQQIIAAVGARLKELDL